MSEPTELEMQKELMNQFREHELPKKFEQNLSSKLTVKLDEKVNIPYMIWAEPQDQLTDPHLQVRHYEQDIAFFIESDISESEKLSLFNTRDSNLQIPLCIVELKRRGIGTNSVIAYSNKAEKIKSVFPFARYIVIAGNERKRKWELHGEEFDAILSLGGQNPENWELNSILDELEAQFEAVAKEIETFESTGTL